MFETADEVLQVLTAHDALRGPDQKKQYAAFFVNIFNQAAKVPLLEARIAAVEAELNAAKKSL